ncbi:MAG: WD40-repeat-containing domain protein [Monoraphidium minutum]|nr:MAG: WD40-repeat-containing domain protein [Monoraphidium minutum]
MQCFASDAGDHGGNPIAALSWVPRLPGLPGGDGHMGWLISSGRSLVNLFECNAGGSVKGEPSLMLMHAQEVDFSCSRLAVEPSLDLMFAVSVTIDRTPQECISVHSLEVERLLAYRYRFAPPNAGRGAAAGARLIQHVVSLHPVGGTLARCCAASYGSRVVIFEAPATPPPPGTTITAARSSWDAHPGAAITALQLSPAAPTTLYSGGNNGTVHSWDMRAKPSAPAAVMAAHTRNVTGLSLVHDSLLASCGIDGRVLLWDPRRPASPYSVITPDGAPALRLAPSPFGDCLAVSTNRGLHCIDLIDGDHGVSPIAPFPLDRPYADITWNAGTGELYAAGHAGSIAVFARH